MAEEILALQSLVSEGWSAKKAKLSPAYACVNTALSVASNELTPASINRVQHQLDVATAFAKNTIEGSNSTGLDSTIAQMVYCKALPFSFGECPYFQHVIDIARLVPRGYKAPKRKILAGDMLGLSYKAELERGFAELMVDADVYGWLFLVTP